MGLLMCFIIRYELCGNDDISLQIANAEGHSENQARTPHFILPRGGLPVYGCEAQWYVNLMWHWHRFFPVYEKTLRQGYVDTV